ncbi:MAG: ABC transporter substrate-binding protein [Candidatus Bathyarchaeia archaeon]|jgi:iron complex transport system substrate-binding protein
MKSENSRKIVDMNGRVVEVPKSIKRVAVSRAVHNMLMLILGSGDKIAATVKHARTPLSLKVYPALANKLFPFEKGKIDTNALKHAQIDAAIVSTNDHTIEHLEALGVPVLTVYHRNLEDHMRVVEFFGNVLGEEESQKAAQYRTYLSNKIEKITSTLSVIPTEKRPKVFFANSFDPIMTIGNNHPLNDWLVKGGGINVATGFDDAKYVSIEQVQQLDPDIIVIPTNFKNVILNNSEWQKLKAVRNNRILVGPYGLYPWVACEPEMALQLQWYAKRLYPDKFEDIDIEEETRFFYKTFLRYNLSPDEINEILNPAN